MRRRQAETVVQHCVVRAGPVKGGRLAYFVGVWTLTRYNVGFDAPIAAVGASWEGAGGVRTMYRRLAEFRAAFPDLGEDVTPDVFARPIIAGYEQRVAQLTAQQLMFERVSVAL